MTSHESRYALVVLTTDFNCFVGCCSSYDVRQHSDLDGVNTQVAEQSNSLLNRLKGMVSYMTEDNFLTHVKMFLAYRNTVRGYTASEPCEGEAAIISHWRRFTHHSRL